MTTAMLKKVASRFSLTEDQVVEEGLKAFLQSRLQALEAERQNMFAKFGVKTLKELDEHIANHPDQESDNLAYLQRADDLTNRVLEIKAMLDDLNGHD